MKRRSQGKQKRSPAPYTKYKKKPHRYSPGYYAWFAMTTGKVRKGNLNPAHERG